MPSDPLLALLEEERRVILAGDWTALEALGPRKVGALDALGDDPARLGPLGAALQRNQALLAAAIDGVREAGRRRQALAAVRAGLVTYDSQGALAEVPLGPPQVERRL